MITTVFVSMEKMSIFLNLQQSATQIALRVKDTKQIQIVQKELQAIVTRYRCASLG